MARPISPNRDSGAVDRSARLVALLELVIDAYYPDTTIPCPVCGEGTLDDTWRARATAELEQHSATSGAARCHDERVDSAVGALKAHIGPPPCGSARSPVFPPRRPLVDEAQRVDQLLSRDARTE